MADATLSEILNVSDVDEDDLCEAMGWLLERQSRIENKLAATLRTMPWRCKTRRRAVLKARRPFSVLEHNCDGKKGKLQVNYRLLTNRKGSRAAIAVSVFKGNTGDLKTLVPQVEKIRCAFGIEQFVMVDDRGMLTKKQIDALHDIDGVDWIGALRSFKTEDLMVRPIRQHLEDRVRAHAFFCMLAYYVQWHMMEAWRPLLYADEDQKAKVLCVIRLSQQNAPILR